MTVSVIIPTYNRNELLFSRSLQSVIEQTSPPMEVLIVADGMEGEKLEELTERFRETQFEADPVLRLWNIDRQQYPEGPEWGRWGLYAVNVRNFGLDHVHGDWVMLLDDDDQLEPRAIETLLAAASDDVDFVYGQSMTYKQGQPIGQIYGRYPPGDGAITHGSFLMRAGLGYRYALDSYDRGRNADADLWLRMVEGGVRFKHITEIVHRYHRNYP